MAIFNKISHKKFKFLFFDQNLTCPNSLDVRASTDVKRGQKFQLEPDQNLIRTWVEPDKSWCIVIWLYLAIQIWTNFMSELYFYKSSQICSSILHGKANWMTSNVCKTSFSACGFNNRHLNLKINSFKTILWNYWI